VIVSAMEASSSDRPPSRERPLSRGEPPSKSATLSRQISPAQEDVLRPASEGRIRACTTGSIAELGQGVKLAEGGKQEVFPRSILKRRMPRLLKLDVESARSASSLQPRLDFLQNRVTTVMSLDGSKSPDTGRPPPSPASATRRAAMVNAGLQAVSSTPDLACVGRRARPSVDFASTPKSAKCVTPYGQLYGQHPSMFDFDRKGRMLPTADAINASIDDEQAPATDKNGTIIIR